MSYPIVKLRDVAHFIRGITFKPDDVVPLDREDAVVCMRTKNVQTALDCDDLLAVPSQFVRREDQYLQEGDILVSSANSWNLVGKCCWIPKLLWRAAFGGFVSVLRGDSAHVDRRYLYWWFSSGRIQALLRSFGQKTTNISNLNIDRCLQLDLPLPPLSEQRRIAGILDKADALRAKRREALTQLDHLAQSIFVEMFGDPVKNSKQWPVRSFNDVCPTRLGKMLDQKQQTGQHSRKYLRNANVQWFRFDLSDLLEMDFDEAARETFALKEGDLLICEGGEPGRAAIWRNQLSDCYYQKALHRGRPDPSLAQAEYLLWLLWCLAKGGGLSDHVTSATIAHLTGEKLKAMRIPLPPLLLQCQFAERLRVHEQLRLTAERALTTQEALFASLQHRAFRGEL